MLRVGGRIDERILQREESFWMLTILVGICVRGSGVLAASTVTSAELSCTIKCEAVDVVAWSHDWVQAEGKTRLIHIAKSQRNSSNKICVALHIEIK